MKEGEEMNHEDILKKYVELFESTFRVVLDSKEVIKNPLLARPAKSSEVTMQDIPAQ